jgi:hypothetical protein
MNPDQLPILVLPTDLDNHAAATLIECLYDAARLLENYYAAQLPRHHHADDERQHLLWPDDQPPF